MKINIYYGGRGLLDDPTLYVISRIENVLKELRVKVERYNIYEHKNEIATLPQTFRDVDGIILATTVEWLGIGGYITNKGLSLPPLIYGGTGLDSQNLNMPEVMPTKYDYHIRRARGRDHTLQCMGDTWRSAVLRTMRICRGYYYVSAK